MSPVWILVFGLFVPFAIADGDCLSVLGGEDNLVGKKVILDGQKQEEDSVPFPINTSEIHESSLPYGLIYRIVHPSTILPDDYISNRVNFFLDDNGVIEYVICT